MRRSTVGAALLILHLAVTGSPSGQPPAPRTNGARLDRAVQLASGGGFWGVALVAEGGRELLARGYGHADYARLPNTPDTLFEIASVSKQFTAAAILRLEMEGRLKTSHTLGRWYPDLPPDRRAITVLQLLSHTAGIDPDSGIPYASRLGRDAMVHQIMSRPLAAPPGTTFAYANPGYAILAALVEKAAGTSFEKYLHRRLFRPAGLKDTGFMGDPRLDRKRMTLRLVAGRLQGAAADWHRGWGYRGMGGVITTARDLLRWDRALGGNKVLSARARTKLFTPVKAGYACGWLVGSGPAGNPKIHHSGAVAGYGAWLIRHPVEDRTVILLTNDAGRPGPVLAALEKELFTGPVLALHLDWRGHTLNRNRALEVTGGIGIQGDRSDGLVRLRFTAPGAKQPLATITIPPTEAGSLKTRIQGCLAAGPPRRGGPALGLYLAGLAGGGTSLELDAGLTLQVLPSYSGRAADGTPTNDPRIILAVKDEATGQWPLMVKLDDKAARTLVGLL